MNLSLKDKRNFKIQFKNKRPMTRIYQFVRTGDYYTGHRTYVAGDVETIKNVEYVTSRWVDLILPNGDEIIEVSVRAFKLL